VTTSLHNREATPLTGHVRDVDDRCMTTNELRTATSHLEQTFREWVRKGMREPAPSFEALSGSSAYLPADVIEMLVTERGLTSFWNYGQAVRQLSGGSSDADPDSRGVPPGLAAP
jgi:hypothetical protein